MSHKKKNDKLSKIFKDRGNESFSKKNFQEAIVNYNKAICNAATDLQLSFLYANRAAAYLEVQRSQECLENIELAKKSGYPKDKMPKLLARQEKCKDLLASNDHKNESDEAANNFFKLSYKNHPTIPFIIDGIECKRSKMFGRHLITTRDLKPGDIIAIEDPFVKYMQRDSELRYERCATCLGHSNLNLIPCEQCSQIMYCSGDCKAQNQFHDKFSCGTVPNEFNMRLEAGMNTCGINVPYGSSFLFNFSHINRHATDETIFDFKEFDRKNCLTILGSLAITDHDKNVPKPPSMSLRMIPGLSQSQQDGMIECLIYFIKLLNANSLGFDTFYKGDMASVGGVICLFGSLFNHSCDSNISRITFQDKIIFFASRPIKAGEQLFISYRPNFSFLNRKRRQSALDCFGFKCKCQACENDWPVFEKLPKKIQNFKMPEEDETADVKSMIMQFKKDCENLEKIWQFHPCCETVSISRHITALAALIAKQKL